MTKTFPASLRKCLALAVLLLPFASQAEQVIESGEYRLHYIAMVTTDLSPDVARVYGITRSRKKGVAILNLQHRDQAYRSPPAEVSGMIRNLIGQQRMSSLREVQEGDARYWIAEFGFSHLETMRFDFDIDPEGAALPFKLKFSQQFYTPNR